ncbi:hypothetical protein HK096_008329, partial [Nowakowskiella sp. JEL0078]
MRSFAIAAVAVLAVSVSAQTCTPAKADLITVQNMPAAGFPNPDGVARGVDNAGGSYGNIDIDVTYTGAFVQLIPRKTDTGYWFFKMEARECWDATGFNAFEFDFSAPVGAKFSMTLTVHQASCLVNNCSLNENLCPRDPDSTYVQITDYVVPNGAVQHARVPFTAFNGNSFGNGTINWKYIKGYFTFIGFTALNQTHTFNNFIVKAGCQSALTTAVAAVATTAVGGTGTGVAVTTAGSSAAATTGSKSSASSTRYSVATFIVLIFAT